MRRRLKGIEDGDGRRKAKVYGAVGDLPVGCCTLRIYSARGYSAYRPIRRRKKRRILAQGAFATNPRYCQPIINKQDKKFYI
jgi:hypothetical protein